MTCASCVGHVEKAIAKLPGVSGVSVNLATERADVTFTGASDPHSVVQAIERAGYAVPEADVEDRKGVVSGKRVSVRVDLGGRRIIKKNRTKQRTTVLRKDET